MESALARPIPIIEPGPAIAPVDASKAAILIVDDDERNAMAAVEALRDLGQELVVARSGEEALRKLLAQDFAVILLDLHMPGMDGYETAALIRSRRRNSRIPIVFLTAVFRDEAHIFQAYSAGAVDVVFKPVDPFILRSKVEILVDLHLKTLEARQETERRQRLMDENIRIREGKLEAERALRRALERQDLVLGALPIAVHSRAAAAPYDVLFISETIAALTGFGPAAFTDTPGFAASRLHPDDVRAAIAAVEDSRETGSPYAVEVRWLCADGDYRTFLDQGVWMPDPEGGPGEVVGVLLDVTERRRLEEQLAHARKMESVGQLTGGVAHDFNNLLMVILANAESLVERGEDEARRKRRLDAIAQAADRGRTLTRQLLAFSRRQHLEPSPFDVKALITGILPLLRQAVGERVCIDRRFAKRRLCVLADRTHLETALINLVVNARDAMPAGGKITIRADLVSDGPASRRRGSPDQDWVVIEVADTGEGISPELKDR
ncbi:MAG: ATP-binding response regulator, partial [Caulobacteraceae bacterium]